MTATYGQETGRQRGQGRLIQDGVKNTHLRAPFQVPPQQLQPHVKNRPQPRQPDDKGAVQVEEDAAHGQHLRAVVLPHGVGPVQESYRIELHLLLQRRERAGDVRVARRLQPPVQVVLHLVGAHVLDGLSGGAQ